MVNKRRQLAEEYAQLVFSAIEAEELRPYRPKRQYLLTLSIRMPLQFKSRLKKASRKKGIEQTRLVTEALRPILAVILQDEEPGEIQRDLPQKVQGS